MSYIPDQQPFWMPQGYHEEIEEYYPLLTWSGRHMWWIMLLIGKINPEWSNKFSVFTVSHWPRFHDYILIKD